MVAEVPGVPGFWFGFGFVGVAGGWAGAGVAGVTASPLPGPSGNVEFFVWFRRDAPAADRAEIDRVVAA